MEIKGFMPITPEMFEPSAFDGLAKSIEEMSKAIIEHREKIVFDFLKSRGYRPKHTKQYAKNLKYHLHKKGIELASEVTQAPFDEKNLTYSETYRVYFRPYTKRKYTK